MRGNEIKQEKAKINLKRKMHGYIPVCERSGCLNGFETTINTFLRLIKIQHFFFLPRILSEQRCFFSTLVDFC